MPMTRENMLRHPQGRKMVKQNIFYGKVLGNNMQGVLITSALWLQDNHKNTSFPTY